MATYTHPVTGEELEYIPYVELDDEQRRSVDSPVERTRYKAAKLRWGLDKLVDDPDTYVRLEVAALGYGLERLVVDRYANVRRVVAEQGFGLEKLVDDADGWVRAEVAKVCPEALLERLVNDPYWEVRGQVARRGYGLERLVNDETPWVRKGVVEACPEKLLTELVSDPDLHVREVVAARGYGLDKLAKDEDRDVQEAVRKRLTDDRTTLSAWIENNPDKCALPENRGYGSLSVVQKVELAARGGESVLQALAKDDESIVRAAVARQGYALDSFIDDPEPAVRFEVAMHGHELGRLAGDAAYTVRKAVALQGFGLDALAEDSVAGVREEVERYLALSGMSLEEWVKENPDKCALPENLSKETIKVPILGESAKEQWANAMDIYLMVVDSNLSRTHDMVSAIEEGVRGGSEEEACCIEAYRCLESAGKVLSDMKGEIARLIDAVFDRDGAQASRDADER